MSNPNQLPVDYEEMEFKVEEEDWNEYELEDDVRIKGRILLAKLMRDPNDPKKMSFDITPPKWAVFAPPHLRGKPSLVLIKDPVKQKSHKKYKVHIDKNHEPWNIYRILRTGQEVKIKLTVDEIIRFDNAFDQNGSPFYTVPNGISVSIKGNQPAQGT